MRPISARNTTAPRPVTMPTPKASADSAARLSGRISRSCRSAAGGTVVAIRRRRSHRSRSRRDADLPAGGEPHQIDGLGVMRRAGVIGRHGAAADLRGAVPMAERDVIGLRLADHRVADQPGRAQRVGPGLGRLVMAVADRDRASSRRAAAGRAAAPCRDSRDARCPRFRGRAPETRPCAGCVMPRIATLPISSNRPRSQIESGVAGS